MRTFVLATANQHKADEMRHVLAAYDVELLERPPDLAEVEENEETLEGNAFLKAWSLTRATGQAAIADDSGLFVDALDGRPGVRSARYAGEGATFEENVAKLLVELDGVAPEDRTGRVRTVIAVTFPSGQSWSVEGVLECRLLTAPVGTGGFGYDPVIAPLSEDGRTLAQLSMEEKNELSARGHALRLFVEKLSAG